MCGQGEAGQLSVHSRGRREGMAVKAQMICPAQDWQITEANWHWRHRERDHHGYRAAVLHWLMSPMMWVHRDLCPRPGDAAQRRPRGRPRCFPIGADAHGTRGSSIAGSSLEEGLTASILLLEQPSGHLGQFSALLGSVWAVSQKAAGQGSVVAHGSMTWCGAHRVMAISNSLRPSGVGQVEHFRVVADSRSVEMHRRTESRHVSTTARPIPR